MRQWIPMIFEHIKASMYCMLWGMVGALSIFILKTALMPVRPHIATIDLTGIMHQYTLLIARKSTSMNSVKSQTQAFSKNIDSVLQQVAKAHHVVLVPRQAVVSGAVDYTHEVVNRINLLMNATQIPKQTDQKRLNFEGS